MKLPANIRDDVRLRLWTAADQIGWSDLGDIERARYYEQWTRDSEIGAKLGHFMDPRKVRVYIKDSLLKPYERDRLLANEGAVLKRTTVESGCQVAQRYIKPHGVRMADGRIICWGKSRDWKLVVMAAFERAQLLSNCSSHAVVLIESGNTVDEGAKTLVRDASKRLGIKMIDWM